MNIINIKDFINIIMIDSMIGIICNIYLIMCFKLK